MRKKADRKVSGDALSESLEVDRINDERAL